MFAKVLKASKGLMFFFNSFERVKKDLRKQVNAKKCMHSAVLVNF